VKKSRKIALLIVLATAFVMLAGVLLYRYFIGSRIQDGGRMENPDAYRVGKELIEFRWQQTHTNSNRCFTMHFYLENDLPVLTGRFLSPDGGETRENGRDASSTPIPWQLTWVQWFELQNTLHCPRTKSHRTMLQRRLAAKSPSSGAPRTESNPKSAAARTPPRWRPWCFALQRRPTAHRSLRRGCRGLLQKAAERPLRAALNNSTFLRRAHGCAPCGITKK